MSDILDQMIYDYEQRLLDRVLQSSFALWNGLLTVNGLIATVFSAVAILGGSEERILAALLVAFCIISSVLLILNFRAVRNHYTMLGSMNQKGIDEKSPEQLAKERNQSVDSRKWISKREFFAEILLGGAALIMIVLLVIGSHVSQRP